MSKNKGRRRYSSNRRLPTRSTSYTPRTYDPIQTLNYILGPGVVYSDDELVRTVRQASVLQKRQLAPRKSHFPKTYGVRTPIQQQNVKAGTPAVRVPRAVCETRAIRSEVIHALNHAGKTGQKTPKWTKKSRIKC